ncbi:hypothetical protein SeMB42_g07475 [Synchytrium endobioticum]|uniref:Uncharacterized protein n=1 Tax=Synchytrium endobioticum TaxID=286115 RepID=A0A507C5S7_9FUNG|nr:hypothetical protein SeMB42_g07475 [Synchytrium endobioticum]
MRVQSAETLLKESCIERNQGYNLFTDSAGKWETGAGNVTHLNNQLSKHHHSLGVEDYAVSAATAWLVLCSMFVKDKVYIFKARGGTGHDGYIYATDRILPHFLQM